MSSPNERSNAKVIEEAFNRFLKSKDAILKNGMIKLLREAVEAALDLHDEAHQSHLTLGDTYGWMLVIDGRMEKMEVQARGDKVGQAETMLRAYVGKVPSSGIIGIVMAGMQPANFFSIKYEKGIFENTMRITKDNFDQYFKKL
jgi:hypothetical protein